MVGFKGIWRLRADLVIPNKDCRVLAGKYSLPPNQVFLYLLSVCILLEPGCVHHCTNVYNVNHVKYMII